MTHFSISSMLLTLLICPGVAFCIPIILPTVSLLILSSQFCNLGSKVYYQLILFHTLDMFLHILQISEIIWYWSFALWYILHNMIPFNSIQVAPNYMTLPSRNILKIWHLAVKMLKIISWCSYIIINLYILFWGTLSTIFTVINLWRGCLKVVVRWNIFVPVAWKLTVFLPSHINCNKTAAWCKNKNRYTRQ